jgi:predicted DNA-binding transcriptional regulator AlpA
VTVAVRPANSDTTPRYLTVRQLADLLQVDRATITRLAARDASMPVLRISGIGGPRGTLRFPVEGITRWLAAKTVGGVKATVDRLA